VTVTVSQPPDITATANPSSICSGESSTLTASGASNYQWSTGSSGSSITVKPNQTTTYTVTGSANGCSNTASVTVTVKPSPNVSVTASPSVLNVIGLSSTLTASGASTYQWSTGASGSSIVVVPLLTTTYSVTGIAANGCTDQATVTVTIKLL
jgi:hypothetical protein